jgi:hypothetical protein
MDDSKVTFDYTIDEAVAFQHAFVQSTREGASWRKREQITFSLAFVVVVGLFAALKVPISSNRSPLLVLAIIGAAVVVGVVLAIPFGHYYDHLVRKRMRRLITEQLGSSGPYTCSIELRPEGAWVAQPGVELTFPWREATRVEDAADGVIVMFKGGRVLARSRAFTSPEHREMFLRKVRELMPGGA